MSDARDTDTSSQDSAQETAQQPAQVARPKRPGGSPVLILLMAIVVVPAVMVADAFDAGPAGIIGGMVGMFSLVAFMGGPLRADLRTAALMGPLLVFGAVVPRLLSDVSRPAAIALVVVIIFVAGLLPLRGPRFANGGLGLGMTTLYAYAYATRGATDHQQVIAAALAGVAVALLVRVLLGISDPSKPTREKVADVLVTDDPAEATATAFDTWLSDGRQRWLGTALEAASRYRLALRVGTVTTSGADTDGAADALHARAEDLADQLRAKHVPPRHLADRSDAPADSPSTSSPASSATGTATATAAAPAGPASDALDAVARAVRHRDTTRVDLDRGTRHDFRDAVLHPSARLRSIQVRHAFRTAFGLLVMLAITATLEPGDPLVSTVLLTTFGILQASWRDTLGKARNKILGLVAGSAAVAVILLAVPERYLTAIAAVSLALGLWYIITRPALGAGFMVVVSVGFNAVTRDLDAGELLVQYTALTACAVAGGLILGFAVVPAFRPAPLRDRVESAAEATAAVLRAASSGSTRSVPQLIALQRDAAQKQDELVPDRERLDDRQLAELDRLQSGLRDLSTIAADAGSLDDAALARAVEMLRAEYGSERRSPDAATDGAAASSLLGDLAEQSGEAERYLLRTLPTS
ncbi:hypothetical protein [Nocardioides sp. zg-DK7169]|uniref:hypothetical protein n=1 Tax=Nocardioides sp. zg-DK7169 TaxID=2736600 RepID=UPI001556A7A8|nr:hypothetical protein [Nocardioides sp. zg-DK7169]NPC99043.1 hypothetical protein [Nocardioides sp. zg-DK7169]